MKVNLIYDNSGPRTPSGATAGQPLAGFNDVGVRSIKLSIAADEPLATSKSAARLVTSNGESIGNAQLVENPLPPGITL